MSENHPDQNSTTGEPRPWMESDVDRLARELHERGERSQTTDLPHAVWSGSFHIFGVEVKCHTLSNGQRIIEADSMHKLLESMGDGSVVEHDLQEFAKWQRG